MKLKKHLGQHFLHDRNILRKIASFLPARTDARIIEIGPGSGNYTEILLEKYREVLCIEIDPIWVKHLTQRFGNHPSLQIIEGDVLKISMKNILSPTKPNIVTGNIPYYITSPLLFALLKEVRQIDGILFLIQTEVAQRIVAREGSRDYGILSVAVQTFFQPRIVYHIPPQAFVPPPRVHSSVIWLEKKEEPLIHPDEFPDFNRFVHTLFSMRRKTIRNNLKSMLSKLHPEEMEAIHHWLPLRAEELSPEQIKNFYMMIRRVYVSK